MRLALNAFFWNRPDTGSGQYTRQLVTHLHRLVSDIEITLVLPETALLDGVPEGVRVQMVPARRGHLGKVWFEQRDFPRAAAGADIAHVPYWGGPLQTPVPTVVTIHDLTTLLFREYRRKLTARLYTSLVSAAARGADHVITDSFASKLDITRHLKILDGRVTAVYLAADARFAPRPDLVLDMAIREKYALPDFYLLYLGGYALHKNIETLLFAYSYVAQALGPDYPLLLAGRKPAGSSAHFPDYDAYIRRLGLGERVRWLGYVEEGDKPALYRGASCFVYPSRYEGFGLPPLEAMACGAPVVTTGASSLPEVVGDAAFTVDPDDARGMAGAMIATVIQENLAADLRQKGAAQAARFSWDTTATETALVYDRLLSSSRP